jgi:hypothetical protein
MASNIWGCFSSSKAAARIQQSFGKVSARMIPARITRSAHF